MPRSGGRCRGIGFSPSTSLRAKRSNPFHSGTGAKGGLLRRFASRNDVDGISIRMSNSGYTSAFSRREAPEVCVSLSLKQEGAGNAGCALHPRSRVQKCARKTHTSIQVQRRHIRHSLRNGFTAYAVISPATNSFLSPSSADMDCLSPVGPTRLRRLDTSNGCQNHTVLPYAATSFVCAPFATHGSFANPPCDHISRPTPPRPPHPIPTFGDDGQRPFLRDRMAGTPRGDLPDGESEILPVGLICRSHKSPHHSAIQFGDRREQPLCAQIVGRSHTFRKSFPISVT